MTYFWKQTLETYAILGSLRSLYSIYLFPSLSLSPLSLASWWQVRSYRCHKWYPADRERKRRAALRSREWALFGRHDSTATTCRLFLPPFLAPSSLLYPQAKKKLRSATRCPPAALLLPGIALTSSSHLREESFPIYKENKSNVLYPKKKKKKKKRERKKKTKERANL